MILQEHLDLQVSSLTPLLFVLCSQMFGLPSERNLYDSVGFRCSMQAPWLYKINEGAHTHTHLGYIKINESARTHTCFPLEQRIIIYAQLKFSPDEFTQIQLDSSGFLLCTEL